MRRNLDIMAEVDYGYGEATDYGYDAPPADYGYGEQPDYGYGEAPTADYGYEQTDYGYGQPDYGYGDDQPDLGYGDARPDEPEEAKPEPVAPRRQQVKRRCSVTKFSLDAGAQEANKAQQDMRNMVDMLRQGGAPPAPPAEEPVYSAPVVQEPSDDKSSTAMTSGTVSCDSSFDGEELSGSKQLQAQETKTKRGMMSRMRKRLSVFH